MDSSLLSLQCILTVYLLDVFVLWWAELCPPEYKHIQEIDCQDTLQGQERRIHSHSLGSDVEMKAVHQNMNLRADDELKGGNFEVTSLGVVSVSF